MPPRTTALDTYEAALDTPEYVVSVEGPYTQDLLDAMERLRCEYNCVLEYERDGPNVECILYPSNATWWLPRQQKEKEASRIVWALSRLFTRRLQPQYTITRYCRAVDPLFEKQLRRQARSTRVSE